MTLPEKLAVIERELILEALEAAGWNETNAALLLGIPRRSLARSRVRLKIERPGGKWRRPKVPQSVTS